MFCDFSSRGFFFRVRGDFWEGSERSRGWVGFVVRGFLQRRFSIGVFFVAGRSIVILKVSSFCFSVFLVI